MIPDEEYQQAFQLLTFADITERNRQKPPTERDVAEDSDDDEAKIIEPPLSISDKSGQPSSCASMQERGTQKDREAERYLKQFM